MNNDIMRDSLIENFIRIANLRYTEPCTIAELTDGCGLSYSQFFRRFKARTGMTPIGYLGFLRMRRAKNLLATTDLTVYEIAEQTGFENEYYFSNYFKKKFALSPTAYRKKARIKANTKTKELHK